MTSTVHIIGAGLAGLSAAVRLAGGSKDVVVHEATQQAGGRCRSYYDQITGMMIDNGNHLLLSGNRDALDYVRTIGTESRLIGPASAEFPFIDLAARKQWTLRLGNGRFPSWVFDETRRVPGTRPFDYLRYAPLLWAPAQKTMGEVVACEGTLYDRLVHPLMVAALNIDPREGSAKLAGTILRETLAAGGQACRPLIARDGLSGALIEPAVEYLQNRNAAVRFGRQLRGFKFSGDQVAGLDFGDDLVPIKSDDAVILAVPPWTAASLVPDISAPSEFRAIVNGHFRIDPPRNFPPIIGVLNGVVEWIFAFHNRLSVTISAADRLVDMPREELGRQIWREVAAVAQLPDTLPPWQIVRERRATFAATPQENAKRPGVETAWSNLYLAGDWTDTGLPATIESAVRSGHRAAARIQG
jgi:squalene-associated FAD-dependent desaturase